MLSSTINPDISATNPTLDWTKLAPGDRLWYGKWPAGVHEYEVIKTDLANGPLPTRNHQRSWYTSIVLVAPVNCLTGDVLPNHEFWVYGPTGNNRSGNEPFCFFATREQAQANYEWLRAGR